MNKHIAVILVLTSLTASLMMAAQPTKASPQTIIVPDDYPTITDAIGNATDGTTIYVRQGTYQEHSLTINKTLSLIGENANTTTIKNTDSPTWDYGPFLPPPPIAIQISADNVKISSFTITGVYASYIPIDAAANAIQLVGNIIEPSGAGTNINGNNNTFAQNTIIGKGNGYLTCTGSNNTITNNTITGQASGNINIKGTSNIIYNNTITNCNGGYGNIDIVGDKNIIAKNNLTNSGFIAISGSSNTIYTNRINGNGFAVVGYNNSFYANLLTHGIGFGNVNADAVNNVFYHNNFVGNTRITVWRGVYGPDFLDNGKEGNYWSDYNGTDQNGDGIGDTPYVVYANDTKNYQSIAPSDISNIILTDHYPLMTPFNISSVTVELPEWANTTPSTPPFPTPTPTPPSTTPTTKTPNPTTPTPSPTTQTATSPLHPTTQQPTPTPTNPEPSSTNNSGLQANMFLTGIVTVIVIALGTALAIVFRRRKPNA